MKGFLLIDKDTGMTSFDVVSLVRRAAGEKRVGHAGTLDPLATGLLFVAVGEATKLLEYFVGCDKEYLVKARFGFVSDTFDADGVVEELLNKKCSQEQIEDVIRGNFLGEIEQVPPKYSALKIDGRRAYDLVRSGEKFEMKSRKVSVYSYEIVDFNWPEVSFKVRCGSGTYIRSLVHDLGQLLGCGAYVQELRRTVLGDFSVENAVKPDFLNNKIDQCLFSVEEMLGGFSRFDLSGADFEGLRDGRTLLNKKIEQIDPIMAFYNGKFVGVVENTSLGVKYAKLFVS